ncbi:hypothetical protein HXX76_003945 [Chlamydomonas incerta]|uniref:MYND-type domain-containing protein n=1 Tax=Chlamydomonas incerta TaxID=51695 RepID=A0A835TD69_CHLIN|nr:hypothetical protein HXX76_003945 [Chlamydomonas incerta]|eukprot:KAG2441093.1 hypothetical protein HXX76_003945 [Chlamydomonas incerta]
MHTAPPDQNCGAAQHVCKISVSQLEDTLAYLGTGHAESLLVSSSADVEPLVVDLVALFGLALRCSAPAPASAPGAAAAAPSTTSGSSSAGASSNSSSSNSTPYLTDEARQLYRRIRSRLCKLLAQDVPSNRLRSLQLDLLLRTHVLRCYSSLLSTYAQLLRARPSRRNLEGAREVLCEAQELLDAVVDGSTRVAWHPDSFMQVARLGSFQSRPASEKPHPSIPMQVEGWYDSHLERELAGSRLLEAWAACVLACAARGVAGGQMDSDIEDILDIFTKFWPEGLSPKVVTKFWPGGLSTSLASLDGGSSYGQAAAAEAAGWEDGNCGPPWTLVRPADNAAAAIAAGVFDPTGLANSWAWGPGGLPRPGLDQLRAQEAEVKRLEAARREVYRSLQAADEARQQQQQQRQQQPAGAPGAELESQAAALSSQLRQARRLPAMVPAFKYRTAHVMGNGYAMVSLRGVQHSLHTGDPRLRYGPPGYRIHFATDDVGGMFEAFVEEAPALDRSCFIRPYVLARPLAAELRSRGVVLPAGLEALLEEAPEAIHCEDAIWMAQILTWTEGQLPQPLPAQQALPPWNDAATFDVCIRLANAARAEWAEWARRSPAASLWQCYCAALEAALGMVQCQDDVERPPAAVQGVRLLPERHGAFVGAWHRAFPSASPDLFRLLPEVAAEQGGKAAGGNGASGMVRTDGGDSVAGAAKPGPEAAALLSAGYLRLRVVWERALLLNHPAWAPRQIGRFRCWAEVLAFGPPRGLLDLLAVAALRARHALTKSRQYFNQLQELAAHSGTPAWQQVIDVVYEHIDASADINAAARLLWTLHAAAPLFAAGDVGGGGGRGSAQQSPQPEEAPQQQRRPHLAQLGLMWSLGAQHVLPCVADGLIRMSAYPHVKIESRPGRNHHIAATVLLCCHLLLTALHRAEAGAAAAGVRGVSSSSSSNSSERSRDSSSSDAVLWRRLLLCDVDVCSLLAATAAIIRHDHQLPGNGKAGGGGAGDTEDEMDVDIRHACAELYSTAVLAAAVLPQECAGAAQQGEGAAPGPEGGTQPPGRYRVPLAAESIAELFGSNGPCPNPLWEAGVREAFAKATAGDGSQQPLSPEQRQACASRAQAAVQQQPDAPQMQVAAALLVPPGRVRSALRRRYPGCRLWLCDNPACVPAAELDARGWPLPPESCSGAGAWVLCGGCESTLYCSDGCRLAHWERGHAAVCRYCRSAGG